MVDITPTRHHLDRRASDLAEAGAGDPDDLLNTTAVAEWLGVSTQWLEIGRTRRYGPPFITLGRRRIRYMRRAVLSWLAERTHNATTEYATGSTGRIRGSRVVDGRVIAPEETGDAV